MLPDTASISVTQEFDPRWTGYLDVTWTNWSQFRSLSAYRPTGEELANVPQNYRDPDVGPGDVNGAPDGRGVETAMVGLDGAVSTFAGTGAAGFADGALASAKLNKPQGLAAAGNGDIYLTDVDNFRVRRIRGGNIETIAGSGTAGYVDNDDCMKAQFYGLEGLTVEPLSVNSDGGRVRISWPNVTAAQVRIRYAERRPAWETGAVIAVTFTLSHQK